MIELKTKKPTIDEQIKLINEARRLFENNPDAEILFISNSVETLRAIEENLLTVKRMEAVENIVNDKPCTLPVDTEVIVEVGDMKTEFIQGTIKHYNEKNLPVVMLYYGQLYTVTNPSKIKEVCDGE